MSKQQTAKMNSTTATPWEKVKDILVQEIGTSGKIPCTMGPKDVHGLHDQPEQSP
jgi:hypothetical protein